MTDDSLRPQNRLPDWDVADLPQPQPLTWRHWTRFIGPGHRDDGDPDRRRRMAARSGGDREVRRGADVDRNPRNRPSGFL